MNAFKKYGVSIAQIFDKEGKRACVVRFNHNNDTLYVIKEESLLNDVCEMILAFDGSGNIIIEEKRNEDDEVLESIFISERIKYEYASINHLNSASFDIHDEEYDLNFDFKLNLLDIKNPTEQNYYIETEIQLATKLLHSNILGALKNATLERQRKTQNKVLHQH